VQVVAVLNAFGEQVHPKLSKSQLESHPSSDEVLASSHVSSVVILPFPHLGSLKETTISWTEYGSLAGL